MKGLDCCVEVPIFAAHFGRNLVISDTLNLFCLQWDWEMFRIGILL